MKLFVRSKGVVVFGLIFSMISCGDSMEKDAEKAANLTLESLEYIASRDLDKSERAFTESKLIRQKYTENSEAFYDLYMTFLAQKQEKK